MPCHYRCVKICVVSGICFCWEIMCLVVDIHIILYSDATGCIFLNVLISEMKKSLLFSYLFAF